VPVGDCQRAFQAAAAVDGLLLTGVRVPWINRRGHFDLPAEAAPIVPLMQELFDVLSGDATAQRSKSSTPLTGDLFHEPTGTFIEIDESQHFTSFRATTLRMYPPGVALGFDRDEYLSLCDAWSSRSDRYRAAKPAVGFGAGGRQRQRAYNDALRDLVTPLMTGRALVRVPAPDRDGDAAYARMRERLSALASTTSRAIHPASTPAAATGKEGKA
jgi:hypothetical protein